MTGLVHLSYGVWRSEPEVADLPGRVAALLTGCGSDTVVAELTAAHLHGLWLPPTDAQTPMDVITQPGRPVPSTRCGSRRAAIRARRRKLRPDEVTVVDGIPVTTEARTWFDLATRLSLSDLVAAGDSALRGSATTAEMAQIIERSRRCPGVVTARAALPYLNARSRSRPESWLRFGLVSGGLPVPAVNEPIFNVHGEWLAEPDLSYADAKLAIEYNGALHAEPDRMRRDMTRGLDVIDGKWWSLSVGPVEVFRRMDRLVGVVHHLRAERVPR